VYHIGNDQILLRIDRGGMGGGEGDIPHKNTFPISDWNDIMGERGLWSHFTPSRHNIFHYCIFGQNGWDSDYNFWGGEYHFGQGEFNDDSFLIFDKDNRDFADDEESKIAAVFMHELGHNIGLWTDGNHCSNSKCSMRKPSPEDSNGYCTICWSQIDLVTCLS